MRERLEKPTWHTTGAKACGGRRDSVATREEVMEEPAQVTAVKGEMRRMGRKAE